VRRPCESSPLAHLSRLLARACVRGEKKLQPTARERDTWIFFNFNLFKIIYKINPWKTLFAPGDPVRHVGWCDRQTLPRHMQRRGRGAMVARSGARSRRGPGLAASHAPPRQPCRGIPPGAAGVSLQAPPLSSSPSPEPAAALTQAAGPPIPAPNRWIWGGKSGGNRSPPPTSNTSQFQIIGKP
jgi:hypothetical protein